MPITSMGSPFYLRPRKGGTSRLRGGTALQWNFAGRISTPNPIRLLRTGILIFYLSLLAILIHSSFGQTSPPSPIIPIGMVQGAAKASENAAAFGSPYDGKSVTIQGVIHQLLIRHGRHQKEEYGFFIQNRRELSDHDPSTSDGLFVYTRRKNSVKSSSGVYSPRVGDEVILTGKIREIVDMTDLTAAYLLAVVQEGMDVDQELSPSEIPANWGQESANHFWERHEGMRMILPAGCIVQGGRRTFGGHQNAKLCVIHPDSIPARRRSPYQRRVFRDAHPLDDIGDQRFDNGNPFRLTLGSLGLKGSSGDASMLIQPARTFDITKRAVHCAVYQQFQDYSLQPNQPLTFIPGPNPAANGRLPSLSRDRHFTMATLNVENLFDVRNDPNDPCDDPGDPGNGRVEKPFHYLSENEATYHIKLRELASQIVHGLNSPDILLLQEIEDQDILRLLHDELVSDEENGDGYLDVLQDLILKIDELAGPAYQCAADRDGADYRGIINAFLYRTDRVELIAVPNSHPILGTSLHLAYRGAGLSYNQDVQNPKAMNACLPMDVDVSDGMTGIHVFSRAPQVALFRLRNPRPHLLASKDLSLYVINNHFSSRPNQRIGQRIEQARVNAVLARAILKAEPNACLVVGGDLNVFPRPDDPVPHSPSDQLKSLYDSGLHNIYDDLVAKRPENAYSYVYQGQANMLDHLFLSPALKQRFAQAWVAHFNSDWPTDWHDDPPFGASDHDPILATFRFADKVIRDIPTK